MLRLAVLGLASASLLSACADDSVSQTDETFTEEGARIVRANVGALTQPSQRATRDIVRDYLATTADLKIIGETAAGGVRHARFEQEIDGLRVHGAYVKAAFDADGQLVQVIERLAKPSGTLALPAVDDVTALKSAFRHLGYVENPVRTSSTKNLAVFARGTAFYREPSVELVAYIDDTGHARTGYVVETWSRRGNILDETLVDGSGRVISSERRTQSDRYNVFVEDPSKGGQTIVNGGGAESPAGWLGTGAQTSTNITGNNAHAYLDKDANNAPDAGGTAVTNGDFLAAADLGAAPDTTGNKNVAVQNLFYLNNRLHDVLYRHGFDEANGNFQTNNFGTNTRGQGDAVNAEAQDGSGTDNANFATPRDGSAPRMQMYLWSSAIPSFITTVGGSSYGTYGSAFGPTSTNTTAALALGIDGVAPAGDGCETMTVSLSGKIALVDRGTCSFAVKVKNAQDAGALAVLIANNQGGDVAFSPAFDDVTQGIVIPSGMVTQNDGAALKGQVGATANLANNSAPRLMVDGDIDADIVFHEYGHGLSWRMIGGMSGAMAGALGEGGSDVLAFLLNGDDRIGEYSFGTSLGIRSLPYDNYDASPKNSYGKLFPLTEVHADGELYAAIMWRLLKTYLANGLTADDLLHDWVNGMNFTPATPAYEHMRDGLLQAAPAARDCWVWEAYAHYGVGVGAKYVTKGRTPGITESFTVPSTCQ